MTQPRISGSGRGSGEGDRRDPPDESEKGMRKATRKRITLAGVLAGAAFLAACGAAGGGDTDSKHTETAQTTCRKVTGKAHVQGTKRYYLVLKGKHDSVLVTHKEYTRYGIGRCFPTEES